MANDAVEALLGEEVSGFEALAEMRQQLGLPPAGSAMDKSTLAVVDLGESQVYGINAHGQQISGVNAISSTHAEIDALSQIERQGINVSGRSLTMHVDRAPCAACSANGGIRSLVERLGIGQLTIESPDGVLIILPR